MGKTNVADAAVPGGWRVEWNTPDGDVLASYPGTPPCAPGNLTEERLAWLRGLEDREAAAGAAQESAE